MTFDHAQSPRLGQKTPVESTYVRMFAGNQLPEAAWPGQIIFRTDTQELQIYSELGGWLSAVGGSFGILTYVGPDIPVAHALGDIWFDTNDGYKMYVARMQGADSIVTGEWELAQDSAGAKVIAQQAATDAGSALTTANDAAAAVAEVAPLVTGDGLAPSQSPAAVVEGGIGALFITWVPITNPSVVTYEVYVSITGPNFVCDSNSLQGEVQGTLFSITKLKSGTALDSTGATTYYARIIARDVDGSGPPGVAGSATVKQVQTVNIAPFAVTSGSIQDFAIPVKKLHSLNHVIY